MCKLYRFILISILLLPGYYAYCQDFSLKLGLNLSNQMFKNKNSGTYESENYRMLITGKIGFLFENPIDKKFSWETGLFLNIKGYKRNELSGNDQLIQSFYLAYVEIPFHVKFSINIDKDKLFLLAGPYFSYGIIGKRYTKSVIFGEESKGWYEYNFGNSTLSNHLKRIDLGAEAGIGYFKSPFIIQASYSYGFWNISQDSASGVIINNRVIGVSFGFVFGTNNKPLFEDIFE